jgi:hypothetical protein
MESSPPRPPEKPPAVGDRTGGRSPPGRWDGRTAAPEEIPTATVAERNPDERRAARLRRAAGRPRNTGAAVRRPLGVRLPRDWTLTAAPEKQLSNR